MAQTEPCAEARKAIDDAFALVASIIIENKMQGLDPKDDPRLATAKDELNEALNRFAGCRCMWVVKELSK